MASYCDGKAKYILEVVCSHQQRFGENVNVGVASNPTKEKKEDQEELETRVAKTCQPAGANFPQLLLIFGQSTRKTMPLCSLLIL